MQPRDPQQVHYNTTTGYYITGHIQLRRTDLGAYAGSRHYRVGSVGFLSHGDVQLRKELLEFALVFVWVSHRVHIDLQNNMLSARGNNPQVCDSLYSYVYGR